MPGKYRPIGVAEKRALLEAAGEEWPIGSDGLPKMWESGSRYVGGGRWKLRSNRRSGVARYSASEKGREKRRSIGRDWWRLNK